MINSMISMELILWVTIVALGTGWMICAWRLSIERDATNYFRQCIELAETKRRLACLDRAFMCDEVHLIADVMEKRDENKYEN